MLALVLHYRHVYIGVDDSTRETLACVHSFRARYHWRGQDVAHVIETIDHNLRM